MGVKDVIDALRSPRVRRTIGMQNIKDETKVLDKLPAVELNKNSVRKNSTRKKGSKKPLLPLKVEKQKLGFTRKR